MNKLIPIIDLFAGPGGLGEGFSAFELDKKQPFKIKLSIEKDPIAHQTLLLRSFFRQFSRDSVPDAYYQYIRKEITRDELFEKYKEHAIRAKHEAWCAELGSRKYPNKLVDKRIASALGTPKPKNWVLIGGPPCQAYSLVGRSRMKANTNFESDPRHFLYKEYLRIIARHRPPVFILENVKGLLSATVKGENIFQKILSDLSQPVRAVTQNKKAALNLGKKSEYILYSLVKPITDSSVPHPASFIVMSEKYGIPQARHRLILLGIRSDLDIMPTRLRVCKKATRMWNVISDLPKLRSALSRKSDSIEVWRAAIEEILSSSWLSGMNDKILKKKIVKSVEKIGTKNHTTGEFFQEIKTGPSYKSRWYRDRRLKGVCNHTARSHMKEDLYRYLFAACYAKVKGRSPKMANFPKALLPKHANVQYAVNGTMFSDRFRVQLSERPATTITSHISKDGHYFIHPDPCQCRSLSVREAARLQTFPDNYIFEGNRTSQYHQVGNAVPPLLAKQIAEIVYNVFIKIK